MAYEILYTPTARKQIKNLDPTVVRRVMPKIGMLQDDPRPSGSTKLTGHSTFYRIRIGDYRVVYDIDDANERIEITIVAHRREAYRDL